MSDAVTMTDWRIHKAIRDNDLGALAALYHETGQCDLKQSGVVQWFVNWIHNLKVRGYGAASPSPASGDAAPEPYRTQFPGLYNMVRHDLEALIYHALRSDYKLLGPLPKGTRNVECARDEQRAKVIAAAIREHYAGEPK